MKKYTNVHSSGFVIWHGLLLVLVVGVVSFIGGSVYNARQKTKSVNHNAEASNVDTAEELKIAQKKKDAADEKQKPVVIPVEEKKAEPVPAPAPVPKEAPVPVKKHYPQPSAKKEPGQVHITASSQVGGDAVILKASLPAAYDGRCKALVKHMDGSNHRWLEASFSNASTCSISVPRSTLTTASEWQYYMYFNSSDWTVKGDSGKHTFAL